jgi:hypothetical protein
MRFTVLAVSALILGGIGFLVTTPGESGAPIMRDPQAVGQTPQLEKILKDRNIWGDDAIQMLASIDRWKDAGETSILVYADRVVGGTKWETAERAREMASRVSQAMQRPRAKLSPGFLTAYQGVLERRIPRGHVQSTRFMEDDSFRVQWSREGAVFLKQLTLRAVTDAYGPPEKIVTEVVHARGERRPAVLTISEYAKGAVKFVQSDLAPDPSAVDRVILDVAAVDQQVFAVQR